MRTVLSICRLRTSTLTSHVSKNHTICQVLEKVYHGEVPAAELKCFIDLTMIAEDGTITRAAFDATVATMRAKATEYVHCIIHGPSMKRMRTHAHKLARMRMCPTHSFA